MFEKGNGYTYLYNDLSLNEAIIKEKDIKKLYYDKKGVLSQENNNFIVVDLEQITYKDLLGHSKTILKNEKGQIIGFKEKYASKITNEKDIIYDGITDVITSESSNGKTKNYIYDATYKDKIKTIEILNEENETEYKINNTYATPGEFDPKALKTKSVIKETTSLGNLEIVRNETSLNVTNSNKVDLTYNFDNKKRLDNIVTSDDKTVAKITYDTNFPDQVSSINNKSFTYDSKGRTEKIKINNNDSFSFVYNDENQLKIVNDHGTQNITQYSYDDGLLTEISSDEIMYTLGYSYDTEKQLVGNLFKSENVSLYTDNCFYKKKAPGLLEYFNKLSYSKKEVYVSIFNPIVVPYYMFEENEKIYLYDNYSLSYDLYDKYNDDKISGIEYPGSYDGNIVLNNGLYCANVSCVALEYNIKEKFHDINYDKVVFSKECVGFFVNVKELPQEKMDIVTIHGGCFCVYVDNINDNGLKLKFLHTSYNYYEVDINLDEWVFVYIEIDYQGKKIKTFVNNQLVEESDTQTEHFNIKTLTLGNTNIKSGKILLTGLFYLKDDSLSEEEIEDLLLTFNNNILLNQDIVNYEDLENDIYLKTQSYFEEDVNYDIVTFNGNTTSSKGLNNLFAIRDDTFEEEKNYFFDEKINRYVLNGGVPIKYDINNSNSGSISLEAKIKSNETVKLYLFELSNFAENFITMRLVGNKFTATIKDNESLTQEYVVDDSWHRYTMTWSKNIQSTSINAITYTIKFYIDTIQLFNTTVFELTEEMEDLLFYVGNCYGKNIEGYIKDLVISDNVLTINQILGIMTKDRISITKEYNTYPCLKKVKVNNNIPCLLDIEYQYNDKNLIKKESFSLFDGSYINVDYEYENNNLITKIANGTHVKEYTYDCLNRLLYSSDSLYGNKTYTYDNLGNIKTKGSISYNYGSQNQLISTNEMNIEYSNDVDKGGFLYPIKMIKGNDTIELTWLDTNLSNYVKRTGTSEVLNLTFEYNHNGQRVRKINNSSKIISEYCYNESNLLVWEKRNNDEYLFYYDEQNLLVGFSLNKEKYIYLRYANGDIYGIINMSGKLVGVYHYDAFGAILNENSLTDIAIKNPFRYKGYYYDDETQLFYCNSRYYSPELCRFISPDSIEYLDPESINGLNLYCYCMNNPIMYADPSGHSVVLALILAGTFAVGFGSSLLINAAHNDWQLDWRDFAQAGVDGLFAMGSTLLAMTGICFWASVGIGAAMGWYQYALGTTIQGDDITWLGSLTAIGFGALGGAISGAGAANTKNIANNMVGLSDDGARAIGAITKAANRRFLDQISPKGMQATLNRWGKIAFEAVQSATPGTMKMLFIQSARNIAIYTPFANIVAGGLNHGYKVWGWI